MRKALIVLLFFFFIAASLFAASAQSVRKGNPMPVLREGETFNGNYFISGELVRMEGTINGDLYAAGQEVIVEGTVNGDVIAGGGEVTISGNVTQDVRVGGGEVTIDGTVGGNVTAGGGEVMIEEEATITGSVVAGGGSVYLLSPIGKTVTAGGRMVKIGNTVGGDILVGSGELILNNKADIQGDLIYYSEKKAEIQDGAIVAGRTNYHATDSMRHEREGAQNFFRNAYFGFEALSFLWALLLGFLILRLMPFFVRQTTDVMRSKLLTSQGVGFVYLFMAPIAASILFLTVIGIPLAFLLLLGYFAHIYFAKIFVAYFIGDKLFPTKDKKGVRFVALLVGLAIYYLLHLIPGIGWIVTFLTVILGAGALIISKRESYLKLRKSKAI